MLSNRTGSVVHANHNGGYVCVLIFESSTKRATFWKQFPDLKSAQIWRDKHKFNMPQYADKHSVKELK